MDDRDVGVVMFKCVCYSSYLHDFDEFEQQFFSVLSFLLLDDDRAHPSGQEESHFSTHDDRY